MLESLANKDLISGTELDTLLPQSHILDGEGSSFTRMCDLALSQNAMPIVFLDGDKEKEAKSFKKKHPDVPVVQLEKGQEFEDLVPAKTYLSEVSKLLSDKSINFDSYERWEKEKNLKEDMMFSKRVRWFIFDTLGKSAPKKHLAILAAIESTDAAELTSGPIVDLFEKMKALMSAI